VQQVQKQSCGVGGFPASAEGQRRRFKKRNPTTTVKILFEVRLKRLNTVMVMT